MKEIIEQILKEEDLAGQEVNAAKIKAQALIIEAKAKAQKDFNEALTQAKQEILIRKNKLQSDLLLEKEKALEETTAESVSIREHKEGQISAAAARTFFKIIKVD